MNTIIVPTLQVGTQRHRDISSLSKDTQLGGGRATVALGNLKKQVKSWSEAPFPTSVSSDLPLCGFLGLLGPVSPAVKGWSQISVSQSVG